MFIGAVTLLAVAWGVCESSISKPSDRFDRQDERFDRQDRELEQIGRRLDRIESTTAEGFRQANDRMDRTDSRIDRLEAKVDKIESLLIELWLRIEVKGDESAPEPATRRTGFGNGSSPLLPAQRSVSRTGLEH